MSIYQSIECIFFQLIEPSMTELSVQLDAFSAHTPRETHFVSVKMKVKRWAEIPLEIVKLQSIRVGSERSGRAALREWIPHR